MKRQILLFFCFLLLLSCSSNDFEGKFIESPTSELKINATVNRSNKSKINYAYVIIHLYNEKGEKMIEINTKASDSQKWSIGWTRVGDTIVLKSSDIGDRAWVFRNNKLHKISLSS